MYNDRVKLSDLSKDDSFEIQVLSGKNCQKLREFGFCEDAEGTVLKCGRIFTCKVCDCRLAISKELAEEIIIAKNE